METSKKPSPSIRESEIPGRPAPSKARTASGPKPKQTKSRNGCITCKAKRLKCDEAKPSCHQCARRKVQCGGYKKDFKWRPFEETNLAPGRPTAMTKKAPAAPSLLSKSAANSDQPFPTPPTTEQSTSPIRVQSNAFHSSSPESPLQSSPVSLKSFVSTEYHSLDEAPATREDISVGQTAAPINVSLSAEAGNRLGIKFFGPPEYRPDPESPGPSFSQLLEDESQDIEEIIRRSDPGLGPWNLTFPDEDSLSFDPSRIPDCPPLGPESQEMLVLRYDKLTCGILSVKDGMSENPWRTLIWPLAKDNPALQHAIFALTAFHSGKENPSLRVQGVKHMRQSINCLMQQIQNMRADAALATSLALAFADTWDQHTRTCIQHLRGAKALMSQVLTAGIQDGLGGEELDRIRFLYNTWSYMDVIARLTSLEECGPEDLDSSVFQLPSGAVHEIDPLMGGATTLFPIMSRVARLIQRVRKSTSNSVSVVSQAMELKALIEQWQPPRWFEPPEDPSSEVQHNIQLAHAYRWATLLYLHQAVPEMPSEPTDELAKRALILLATIPPTSRTTIIQVFPLLAAGSEVDMEDDRKWVLERWATIQSRLMLGGVDRCLEVLQEVWARRDAFQADKHRQDLLGSGRTGSFSNDDRAGASSAGRGDSSRTFNRVHKPTSPPKRPVEARSGTRASRSGTSRRGSALSPLENIEFERTVRGRLHWVNVMAEWGWEGYDVQYLLASMAESLLYYDGCNSTLLDFMTLSDR
ncbi:hypothetical protein NUU61_007368 [Penicillium alfredii]|uniref:Zn(2)-C6 fungal-type domain-containing protein n=1 Tax=Penicillium alfredii TaxID=1506179 RepID=A0A9W9F2L9_9EURO|nr:uncharacterized protein NUU61_007368 [Penicillium alfredii]KAJ5092498.1 hypothetical protein NUU61_007368 [Penicillium alfredii]